MEKLTKQELEILMDLILSELEAARNFRIKFSNKDLQEEQSDLEMRLIDIFKKLNKSEK